MGILREKAEYCLINIYDSRLVMRGKRDTRLCDNLAFRITLSQRIFLERIASERGVSLCEGARLIIDEAMSKEGAL
jgi:hypothetical protein